MSTEDGPAVGADPAPPGLAELTSPGSYFEDFRPGETVRHTRGRTIEGDEHMILTHRALNTAQIHFNQALAERDPSLRAQFEGRRVVAGPLVLAFAMGLASEDTTENALAIRGLAEAKHGAGVFAGDTLFAESRVLETRPSERPDAGIVTFRLTARTARDPRPVLEATYEALIRRRGSTPATGDTEEEK
jgi:acyl dehydratase